MDKRTERKEWAERPGKGFGARLREARIKRKLTMEQLAAATFVTKPTIARCELRGHLPGLSIAIKLARVLGVSLDWLVEDEP